MTYANPAQRHINFTELPVLMLPNNERAQH